MSPIMKVRTSRRGRLIPCFCASGQVLRFTDIPSISGILGKQLCQTTLYQTQIVSKFILFILSWICWVFCPSDPDHLLDCWQCGMQLSTNAWYFEIGHWLFAQVDGVPTLHVSLVIYKYNLLHIILTMECENICLPSSNSANQRYTRLWLAEFNEYEIMSEVMFGASMDPIKLPCVNAFDGKVFWTTACKKIQWPGGLVVWFLVRAIIAQIE